MAIARVPITVPGAIHHVRVCMGEVLLPSATHEFHVDVGVGLGAGVRGKRLAYSQVANLASFVPVKNVSVQSADVPIVYSVAGGAPGIGFPSVQGRPYFFGKEVDRTVGAAPVRRRVAADDVASAAAEGVPGTNGLEQFIEVRSNINMYDTAAAAYTDISLVPHSFGEGAGITVYIYGKMALTE